MMMSATIGHNSGRRLFTAPIVEVDSEEAIAEAILQSDAALNDWIRTTFIDPRRKFTVVRASTYASIDPRQEFWRPKTLYWGSDPRRPVVMRGALDMMILKHRLSITSMSPNGYAIKVMERYIRRFQSIDRKWNRLIERGELLIRSKYAVSYVFFDRVRVWEKRQFGRQPIDHPRPDQRVPALQHGPRIVTTKSNERVILRAVYELGLVSPSTTEKHNGTR